jgi:hypothetical protein
MNYEQIPVDSRENFRKFVDACLDMAAACAPQVQGAPTFA